MTPDRPVSERLEELRRLREAATPGPYGVGYPAQNPDVPNGTEVLAPRSSPIIGARETIAIFRHSDDALLFERAVDALPALLDIAEAAEAMWRYDAGGTAEYDALRAALDRLNAQ